MMGSLPGSWSISGESEPSVVPEEGKKSIITSNFGYTSAARHSPSKVADREGCLGRATGKRTTVPKQSLAADLS